MKKIYIMFSYTGTLFSKFLTLFSEEKYVHVSIALDSKFKNVYSFGRKNPRRIFPAGFVKEDLKLIYTLYSNSITRIYELEISEDQYNKLKKIINETYINNEKMYRYNIKGLPMINFNLSYQREYHYVCSQFCGKVLMDAGIYDFNKDYSIIKPKDLIELENLKLIYEGRIKDYFKIEKNT
ncbi:MAG: hypothetical protein PHF21_02530 [Bacilli bacterium]|nr:hypothetical protein [Bacilli bacterium]